jgi:hypothetical protein
MVNIRSAVQIKTFKGHQLEEPATDFLKEKTFLKATLDCCQATTSPESLWVHTA